MIPPQGPNVRTLVFKYKKKIAICKTISERARNGHDTEYR